MKNLSDSCNRRALGTALAFLAACLAATPTFAVASTGSLELGVLPNVSARVLMTQYEPMQSHLTKGMGVQVQVSSAPNWRDFYQRLKQGQYQVAVLAGNVARLAEKDLGYQPLASYEPLIPGLLVTRKGVNTPPAALLSGQTLALANPASLVALEGLRWLGQLGLAEGKQFQTVVVRAEDSMGSLILRGEASAGIMSMGELRAHTPEVREQLAIHTQFAQVTSFVVMASPRMEPAQAERLKQLLLSFDSKSEEGRLFFERSGFRAIVPPNTAALLQLDTYVDSTRKLLD